MRRTKYIIFLLLLAILTLHCTSCTDSEEKIQKSKDTFASFDNSEQFVFVIDDEIRVGNRVTKISDIIYNGDPCNLIYPDINGMYVYSAESHMDTSIDIVYVEYESLETTLIKSLSLPKKLITVNLINDIFYFRMDDPEVEEFKQMYFLYDMKTDQTSTADADDLIEYVEQSDRDYEHYYNFERFSLSTIGTSSLFRKGFAHKFYITDNQTGMTRLLDESLLHTCEEGKNILSFGEDNVALLTYCGYEKDGYVYLLFSCLADNFFGEPVHYFIMKYDFDSHTAEYYTSVYYELFPDSIIDLYIP